MADVKSLDRERRRGWRGLSAGVLLVLMVGAVWVWVDRLFAGNSAALTDSSTTQLLGRLNVAFALGAIAGLLGIVNGWLVAHSGRRNNALVWAIVVVAIAAFFTALAA